MDHNIDKDSCSTDTSKGDIQKQTKRKPTDSAETSSTKANKRTNDGAGDTNANKKIKKDNGEISVKRLSKYGKYSFMEDEDGYVHVFTDGSCEGKMK